MVSVKILFHQHILPLPAVTAASPFITLPQVSTSNRKLIKSGAIWRCHCSLRCCFAKHRQNTLKWFLLISSSSVSAAGKFRSGFGLGALRVSGGVWLPGTYPRAAQLWREVEESVDGQKKKYIYVDLQASPPQNWGKTDMIQQMKLSHTPVLEVEAVWLSHLVSGVLGDKCCKHCTTPQVCMVQHNSNCH